MDVEEDRQTSHHGKHHENRGDHPRLYRIVRILLLALTALVAVHMWHIKAKMGCLRKISDLRKEQEKAAAA